MNMDTYSFKRNIKKSIQVQIQEEAAEVEGVNFLKEGSSVVTKMQTP